MNIFRRLPIYRLLLGCGAALAVGIGATALAFALDSGPTPPARSLADAIHDALSGPQPAGFSANVQLTNNLLEGASLAGEVGGEGAGGLLSDPLVKGGSGRVWVAKSGEFRLELQSESGDTEIVWDGHSLELYDAAQNTIYRYTPPAHEHAGEGAEGGSESHESRESREVPSVAKIEEAIAHARRHAAISEASPTDVGGEPAYSVSLAPKQAGSLLANVQLAFDSENGVPLRAAVYSTASPSAVLELAASEISFGPVEASVFQLSPPASAKVKQIKTLRPHARRTPRAPRAGTNAATHLTVHGRGPGAILVMESKASRKGASEALHGLPQVKINGVKASELRTALGTLLSFERGGVSYLLAGSVKPGPLQALASGL